MVVLRKCQVYNLFYSPTIWLCVYT